MPLLSRYQAGVAGRSLNEDPAQLRAIAVLDRVAAELTARSAAHRLPRLLGRILPLVQTMAPTLVPVTAPVRGAYLWGGVGRGKTLLMDLFFESLPFADKRRYHFHHIMSRVKNRLAELHDVQDPLAIVATELAGEGRVICFDEFFVADIADAMLLGRFIAGLLERGVTLVATSNTAPRDLYRGGLQRQQFLPAIELLERHTEVVHVDGLTDYRLRVLETADIWQVPPGAAADADLERYFEQMASGPGIVDTHLDVLGRRIPVRRRAVGVVWFDFSALCEGPRSAEDYIEIASSFQTVLVSGVPSLDATRENAARRFIALVDELYDRRVNLIVSAALPIARIYSGTRLRPEFERTRSRLLEMQSVEYLAAGHLQ